MKRTILNSGAARGRRSASVDRKVDASAHRTFLITIGLILLGAGSGAAAQDILYGTPMVPDHDAIRANKAQPPGTLLYPIEPMSPDPMISTLPPGADYKDRYWKKMRAMRAQDNREQRQLNAAESPAAGQAGASAFQEIVETENGRGANDVQGDAQRIRRFGTGPGEDNQVIITGALDDVPALRMLTQMEDDGSIPLALETGIVGGPDSVSFSGVIGDGPMPGIVSDYDFVRVFLPAGSTFEISVATPEPFGDLDPFVTFYLLDGTIIFQQDDGGNGYDTFAKLTTLTDLDFVMAIGGFGAFEPADPFDSTGGSITGAIGSEGEYDFQMRVFATEGERDVDFYSFYLDKGDVLGAAVRNEGIPGIRIFNRSEMMEKGVSGFGSFADPSSPLPVDGSTVIDYVAEEDGMYAVALDTAFGGYELELGVYRPGFEESPYRIQLIWLDYNGGPVDKAPWFGFPLVTDHTPLRGFLSDWGLPDSRADVRRITKNITRETRDNLQRELARSGMNENFGVVVLGNDGTGRWHWMERFIEAGSFTAFGVTFEISVVEVSGTIDESFISTIGIASTIDTGNYSARDAALVLLDVLSAPPSGISANFSFSLNDVVLAPRATKEQLVVTVLGNIIAHEVGHYIGNFHTDGLNATQNIMDEGPGGLFNLAGIGPSGVFGARDQTDVSFVDDVYSFFEGFAGMENTPIISAFGLSYFPPPEEQAYSDD